MTTELIGELKRRRVFRAVAGYAVAAFAVLQVIEPVVHGLRWPDAVVGYVVVALAAGFPVVAVLAWLFDVRAGAIERTAPTPAIGRTRLVLALVALVLVVAAPAAVWFARRPAAATSAPAAAAAERWRVPIGDSPVRGPAGAPVTVVEFADFQCPYSNGAAARLRRIQERFPGKVRVVWKDYPMALHPEADATAQLAREAAAQRGPAAFWTAHDRLVEIAPRHRDAALREAAAQLRLDPDAAAAAIASERHRAAIDADVDLAAQLGVTGIPSFFVNGRRFVGNDDGLDELVAEELAGARSLLAAGVAGAEVYARVVQGGRDGGGPAPAKVQLPDARDRPARGGPRGKALEVHQFCDLGSQPCAWAEPQLRRLLASYGDEVRHVFWDIADPADPVAARVSRAAETVLAQPEVWWKLHDALYERQNLEGFEPAPPDALSHASLRALARGLGADMAVFDYRMSARAAELPASEALAQARAQGRNLGDVVIGGEVFSAFSPPRRLRVAIDRALARR